jgi:hypothetical protein
MLKNIKLFMGEDLALQYDQVRTVTPMFLSIFLNYRTIIIYAPMQAYIDKFRRELPVVLVDSPYNKLKYKKMFKMYHAILSDAAADEDDENASS